MVLFVNTNFLNAEIKPSSLKFLDICGQLMITQVLLFDDQPIYLYVYEIKSQNLKNLDHFQNSSFSL